MGCDIRDMLKDTGQTLEQFYISFLHQQNEI